MLFGIPRTTPDPLPPGVTPTQAVEAVESTSWAKGIAEGVCSAAGLTGVPYSDCVRNYKRKVALGALGLTAAQLTGQPAPPKRRGPGRIPAPVAPPETEAPTPAPAERKKYEKTEQPQEHFIHGKKTGNWLADVHEELQRGNDVFFTGDPGKSGTKILVIEKSGKSYISRPLSIQELDTLTKEMKKDKSLTIGVQLPGTAAVNEAKKA